MLTLTENAASVVKTIAGQAVTAETGGLRFSRQGGNENALSISAAEAPEVDDQVVERDGARVFLAQDTVEVLDDQILDAQVDSGGGVQFTIAPQS
jgi:Fe-S cluster assembly iron-binding protein IscA